MLLQTRQSILRAVKFIYPVSLVGKIHFQEIRDLFLIIHDQNMLCHSRRHSTIPFFFAAAAS